MHPPGHEAEGEPVFKRLSTDKAWQVDDFARETERHPKVPAAWFRPSMFNWWLWVQPGFLFFVDEIQFVVPRGTIGKKPPLWIALLEVHRHYGCDWIVLTQHPQLLDTTIRALVGLHRHIRSVLGSPICMEYRWDHASNPERYQLATKSTFRRRRSDYQLFRSASMHVKPPNSGRTPLIVVCILAVLFGLGMWRFQGKFFKEAEAKTDGKAVASATGSGRAGAQARPASGAAQLQPVEVRGCYSYGDECACQDQRGAPLRLPLDVCMKAASTFDGLVAWRPREGPLEINYGARGGQGRPAQPTKPEGAASSPAALPALL